ncbi:putative copper radical oxidase [Phaeomoniella chlamydospora]|uniref:Putative copper radical oxidase n=1 Tax=Phaeomoniella chlamydospora TaxID=158046 RepID=A0A0G2E2Z3_PHACM|nr:putative copper radical oxidase [Phaeomoniella chlamydospora]
MPEQSDDTEPCGGSNRITIFTGPETSSSGESGDSTTTTVSAATSTPIVTDLPSGWTYQGCYVDNANGRAMAYQQTDSSSLTVESCITECVALGYTVAGMEYSSQCFCDDYVRNGATLASESECNMACSGDSSGICGAGNRLSIYSDGPLEVLAVPAAQNTSLPGSWKYQGCLLDGAVNRTFFWQLILTDNNTATNCLTQCAEYGYNAGGMEYGDECYCGDVQNVVDQGATLQPESDCNVACSGNASYICGGGNRLSYYTWEGDPLYTWTFAQGIEAGSYDFIMSSPIIALVSSVATNGKVVFLEKYGTSQENNSSGTYEFDPSLAPDYDTAFRELHVETDIFCSASIVLPDKVGRQINVGGWSGDATYGIRIYWPDGSLGVPGTNDWQENYEELSLQQGRWYPSAMVLANGSILVVGGEEGSNGAPVPTLELLPRVGGVVECDYLARTDPYSTYPFLAVLPSGGVFIGYYNEARVLSSDTFATIKELPNIPGQVNDFLAGRTYPFEGTMMLMPQYAPYDEPLTILICGGSNPGPAYGVDNCVSIQPDSDDPTWTIERMPSSRVIVCMVSLPDGTYLILNGGENGAAGFGLGRDPNHNAVLYDPAKSVGSRMTSMANTTIDRLYHSEAILMMDGSILVSGSDPEDGTHPQEHRLEYFSPPYLLSGASRPAFSIDNTDWAYGETVSFTLTAQTSTDIRVSLIAAMGSTHDKDYTTQF